ncbi:MAG: hydroxymethylbilane synthase [Chloroflexota bacterium]
MTVRLGTRGSELALAQAAIAADALRAAGIGPVEIVSMTTRGDRISRHNARGGWEVTDGQFTGELERGLLRDELDIVVHSYKDLPTLGDERLCIAAVLQRADPRDCLLTAGSAAGHGSPLDALAFGARIATSSPRRAAQLASTRPDLVAMPIRGNVPSRLARLERGEFDGLMVAAAGLDRLGLRYPADARLPLDLMLPAPAQGALAIQARRADAELRERMASIEHGPTRLAVDAERALLRAIGGGCLAPLGALGEVRDGILRLRAAYEDERGAFGRVEASGPSDEVSAIVARLARELLSTVAAIS